jgi:hypothetical protein
MTLYHSPEASLTYNPVSETLLLSYSATQLSVSFGLAYQRALEEMLARNVGKLLLDLKHNAQPTEDKTEQLMRPLLSTLPDQHTQPLFIAAVVSEGQYQYQIGSSIASSTLPPARVEFNYFTCHLDATEWLSEN